MRLKACFTAHLPSSIGQHEETEGYGCSCHGVSGRHAVLRVVENLHLHHRRRCRPGPADHIFGGLSQKQVPSPNNNESPAHQSINVPEEEGEKDDEEHLVAQLSPKGEQVKEKPVLDQKLLTNLFGQGVFAERFGSDSVRLHTCGSWGAFGPYSIVDLHPLRMRGGWICDRPIPDINVRALLDPFPQFRNIRFGLPTVLRFDRKRPYNAANLLKPRYMTWVLEIITNIYKRLYVTSRHCCLVPNAALKYKILFRFSKKLSHVRPESSWPTQRYFFLQN